MESSGKEAPVIADASFRDLLESAPDAVVITDSQGRILLVNRQTEATFGCEREALLGQPIEVLLPERFRQGHIRQRSEYQASPRTRPMGIGLALWARHRNGTEFPVEISLSPTRLANTDVVISIVRDVSERKRAEAALQEAAQAVARARAAEATRLQQVLDVLPEGILIADAQGECITGNAAAAEILGAELVGQRLPVLDGPLLTAEHPDGSPIQAPGLPLMRSLRHGDVVRGEQLVMRNATTGRQVPLLLNSAPLRDESKRIYSGVVAFQDISTIKDIERQKDELLASVSHILEGITESVCALDETGIVLRVNSATCALVGQLPEDLIGRSVGEVFRLEDAGGRRLDGDEYPCREALNTRQPITVNNLFLVKPDGNRVPLTITSAFVKDSARQVAMVVEVIRDVSREREAEELKNRIISLVSHELRTPIGHIKGFSSSLLETDVEWNAATQRDFIAEIDHEADRLAALVTDLLDMSKIESGAAFLDRGMHSPSALLSQALQALERTLSEHTVIVDLTEDLPDLCVDGSQMERVLVNLIENAGKYSPPSTEIRISGRLAGDNVEFCVSDQGPGIPLEHRQHIFDRFVRLHRNGPRKPGTGLGLPICKGIVEAHGGRLWLESEEGRGSRFFFSVPLAPETQLS